MEGMRPKVLEQALRRAGATFLDGAVPTKERDRPITKADLFSAGLSGGEGAAARRGALLRHLELPGHMSANALLPVLNALYTHEEMMKLLEGLDGENI